jgi:transposase
MAPAKRFSPLGTDRFWLTDARFAKIAPHLPTDTRGKARVDDRRVISGIVHVLKSGGRWIDAPSEYGPRKTLYNRYVRWAAKGACGSISSSRSRKLAARRRSFSSTPPRSRRIAPPVAAKRGARRPGDRSIARRTHDQNPCADRRSMPTRRLHGHGRQCRQLRRWRRATVEDARL